MAKGLGASKVPSGREPADKTEVGALDVDDQGIVPVVTGDSGDVALIGRYTVKGVLGRGGMGVVYDVVDRETKSAFALKTIEKRFLSLAESNAEVRFRQEISVLERLNHPSVVRLFDSGFAHHPMGYQLAFFVMERLDGDTLDREVKVGKVFAAADALAIIRQLADALDYLSRHQVLHRDIKPANLFREKAGRVVLMDFGLARSDEFTRLTLAGQIVGTYGYMSPERLTGKAFDVYADVYALGVVLYQMLAGFHPWSANSPTEMLEAIKRGLPIPESFQKLPAGPEIEALVRSMLAYKAEDRPSPAALRTRIDLLLDLVAPLPDKTKTTGAKPRSGAVAFTQTSAFGDEETPALLTPVTPPLSANPLARQVTVTNGSAAVTAPGPSPSWAIATVLSMFFGVIGFVAGILFGRASVDPPIAVPVASERVVVVERPTVKPREETPRTPSSFQDPTEAFSYAETLLQSSRYKDAIPILMRALELNPAYAEAHRLLGDAHAGAGEDQSAAEHYKTYLALRPSADDAPRVRKKLKELAP